MIRRITRRDSLKPVVAMTLTLGLLMTLVKVVYVVLGSDIQKLGEALKHKLEATSKD